MELWTRRRLQISGVFSFPQALNLILPWMSRVSNLSSKRSLVSFKTIDIHFKFHRSLETNLRVLRNLPIQSTVSPEAFSWYTLKWRCWSMRPAICASQLMQWRLHQLKYCLIHSYYSRLHICTRRSSARCLHLAGHHNLHLLAVGLPVQLDH